jgi:hypothetical protein
VNSPKNAKTKPNPPKRQDRPSPWPKWLGISAGVALVGILAATVLLNAPPVGGVPEGTESIDVAAPQHVEGDIHTDGEIPAGGPHSSIWQNCDFYEQEIRSENAVHSLEHGAVWITYRPDLSSADIDRLRGFVRRPDKVLVSPVNNQEPAVVATAWASQLEISDVSDPRLAQFVYEFEGSSNAPEPGGSCSGGVG